LDFIGKSKSKQPVVIKEGMLIEGVIDQATIGQEKGELIRALVNNYGHTRTLQILGKIFRLGIASLGIYGFTTAISDTDLPKDVQEKCREAIYNAEKRVAQLIGQYESKELEPLPGQTLEATLEVKILEVLNKARQRIGEVVGEISDANNSTITMALAGAKGNLLNLAMIAACVGQQSLSGKRIDLGYRNRTLSMFNRGDLSPEDL